MAPWWFPTFYLSSQPHTMNAIAPIDTDLALLIRSAPDLLEVHFKPDVTINSAGIQRILQMRQKLTPAQQPARVLIVLPEQPDFDVDMITTDQYRPYPVEDFTRAVAWVVHNDLGDRITRLYFAYFPPPVPTQVFRTEVEARSWMNTQ